MSLPSTQQIADATAALQALAARGDSYLDAVDDLIASFQNDVTAAINAQNDRFNAASSRRIFVDPVNGDDTTTVGNAANPYRTFNSAVASITAGESIELIHYGDLNLDQSTLLRLVDIVIIAGTPAAVPVGYVPQRATMTANNLSTNNPESQGRLSLRGAQLRLDTWDVILPEPASGLSDSGQTMFFNRGGLQLELIDTTLARSAGSNGANAWFTNTTNGRLDVFTEGLVSSLDAGQFIRNVAAGADPNDTPGVSSDVLVN